MDVCLRNTSGLSGIAKKSDLPWFLSELCGMDYIHLPHLPLTLTPSRKERGIVVRRILARQLDDDRIKNVGRIGNGIATSFHSSQ